MEFNPQTLKWNMSDNLLRLVIHSDIGGYPAMFHFYDDDFARVNEDNVPSVLENVEIGWPQFIIEEVLLKHGAQAPFKKSASSTATASAPSGDKWACPEHGGSSVYAAMFGKGLQCNRWETYVQGNPIPAWANPQIKDVNGSQRFYCAQREFAK